MKMVKLMCVLACCAGVSLMAAGCSHNDKKASPGAMGDKSSCCTADSKDAKKASPGVMSQKSGCCSGDKASGTCTDKAQH